MNRKREPNGKFLGNLERDKRVYEYWLQAKVHGRLKARVARQLHISRQLLEVIIKRMEKS